MSLFLNLFSLKGLNRDSRVGAVHNVCPDKEKKESVLPHVNLFIHFICSLNIL